MTTQTVTDLRPPPSSSAIVRKLGAMTLLSEIEIDFLEGIQNNTVSLPAGTDFVGDGEEFKATFLVREGWVARYILLPDGRRQILSFALPGDILGLHINFRRKSSYSAAAQSDVELALIEPLRMIEISQNYPVLAAGMSWCTSREFAVLGDQAVRLRRLVAYERMCHFLLEMWFRLRLIGLTEDRWFEVPLTQVDISDTLGLSLVHTNRQLGRLRRDGLINVEERSIKINDVDKMIEISGFNSEHLSEFRI